MVRIAVFSDTHGDLRNVSRVAGELGPVDWLIHAGDYLRDAAKVAERLGMDELRVRAVVGNCDYPLQEPLEEILEVDGVRIWIAHGHLHGVKSRLDRVLYRAQELRARVAVFGHSHVAVCVEEGGVLLLNPGSLSSPRLAHAQPTAALLEVEAGKVTARLVAVG